MGKGGPLGREKKTRVRPKIELILRCTNKDPWKNRDKAKKKKRRGRGQLAQEGKVNSGAWGPSNKIFKC